MTEAQKLMRDAALRIEELMKRIDSLERALAVEKSRTAAPRESAVAAGLRRRNIGAPAPRLTGNDLVDRLNKSRATRKAKEVAR